MKISSAAVVLYLAGLATTGHAATVSPLHARGYTVLPEPQQVRLGAHDFRFGPAWRIEVGTGVEPNGVAADTLREEIESRFHLPPSEHAALSVKLEIAPGSITPAATQDRDTGKIAEQAYKIDLAPAQIRIQANAAAGLFYGVETLVQLLHDRDGSLWLPPGEIADWPDLQLRQLYWDDAHHLDKFDVLKRAIRQAAFFKINGFVIKLEGHFQYRSAPALVEPYALSPAQLQELTNYGLRYYVQLIPYLDGPAHIAFILKHPEYAKLRAFPDSNYELCVTNPDSYKLLEGMYDDLLAANRGVHYFYLSTDEPYYVGMADNSQCNEKNRAKQLGSVGKLLAEFVTKTANYLHDRGRTVVFWGEYPMKPADVASLPSHVVNGEVDAPDFDRALKAHGIRQTIYTSIEGEEPMFPDYFLLPPSRRVHPRRGGGTRVAEAMDKVGKDPARGDADLFGMIVAGWADPGVHPEAFWLGYATATAAGWHPNAPDPREAMSDFYPLFYGAGVVNMDRIYQLMSQQAQIWADTWDTVDSTNRKPIWGNSYKIFSPPHPARDQTISLPPVPSATDLGYSSAWAQENRRRLEIAADSVPQNNELLGLLYSNLTRAKRNRYNLEVYVSIAQLCGQNLEMLRDLSGIDRALSAASAAAGKQNAKDAIQYLDHALATIRGMRARRNAVYHNAVATWYKSWEPRVAEANGRRFLHELDDVKDHVPDRTVDMSYLIYRELNLPVDAWYSKIQTARNQYASAHHLPPSNESLNWKNLN